MLHLSGESVGSFQNSRLSTGLGALHPFGIEHAIEYVEKHMQTYGYNVELHEYRKDYAPNVISCMRGEELPNEIVILGYASRPEYPP